MYQYQVGFGQAIQMAFQRYAQLSGRSSRSEFWWFYLFNLIVGFILGIIGIEWLIYAVNIALLLPSICVGVRRLHDINRSGWWYFLNLIPVVGQIILIVWWCQPSQDTDNQYGPVPNVAA